ncbi:MerR family transcriptional regulator [Helicobacter mesocricetorum]|uniref:MerR family transcriptional regulator n=1 Tax=Helicobacter mesocricetorum TaxID=87012 RepID=UPI000CF14EC6|nr:MerR family transcriptional regulator [Helicobacter mesocricetorum]
MAYTIIEVERKTGIPSTKIRFWIKKGLFPLLQSDKNNVRYFSQNDIDALRWVEYLRHTKMEIKTIKLYMDLYMQGESTIPNRKKIIKNQINCIKEDLAKMQEILKILEQKYALYEKLECVNPTKRLVKNPKTKK